MATGYGLQATDDWFLRRRSTILWLEARSLWSLHFRFDAALGNWVRTSAALIDGSVDREEPILVLRDKH